MPTGHTRASFRNKTWYKIEYTLWIWIYLIIMTLFHLNILDFDNKKKYSSVLSFFLKIKIENTFLS